MLSQIEHVRVMLQVVGYNAAETVSALTKAVELDLCLMVGDRNIIFAPYYLPP